MSTRRSRVLIIDDSVVIRRLLSDCLGAADDIEVVGTAPNGRLGLQKIEQCSPDLVTLDVEMPGMSGIEVLNAIRQRDSDLPVVMFSTLTESGASTTLEALARGASDYATKPQGAAGPAAARAQIQADLLPKIRVLTGGEPALPAGRPKLRRPQGGAVRARTPLLGVIGVSTGGPNALSRILPELPADFPVPLVIVQHMPPVFTRSLADRLDRTCALHVQESREGADVHAGQIWIAAGGCHTEVCRVGSGLGLRLHEGPPVHSCRPAVDTLFRSAAIACGGDVVAAVLTGMGRDGLSGAEELYEHGAAILAQDEKSSVVWGMPGYVARAGIADEVVSLANFAQALVRHARPTRRSSGAALRQGALG